MRYFYIKTQGVEPERSILLILLVPGDWRKLMLEGLDNIAGPGQAVDHTCIRRAGPWTRFQGGTWSRASLTGAWPRTAAGR